jgi:hypothetical protein
MGARSQPLDRGNRTFSVPDAFGGSPPHPGDRRSRRDRRSLAAARHVESDRIALETYRDARAAMALIREAVGIAPRAGSVPREGYLTPEFTSEAAALVRGIYAIADRCPPKHRRG